MAGERDLFGEETAPAATARFGRRVFLAAPVRALAEDMRRRRASLEAIAKATGLSVETVRVRLAPELERGLPGGRRQGRPPWEPTAEERATVAALAADGVALERIAALLGVSAPTLRRRCAAELAGGRAQSRRRERP